MRVLIVSDVTGYMRGGVPASMVQLIRGLAARGHALALAGDIVPPGAEAARHFPLTLPTGTALGEEVRRAVAAFEPDIVHAIAMGSRGVPLLAPALRGLPWVMTVHSLPPYERKLPLLHAQEGLHYALRGLRFLPNTLAWKWLLRRPQVVPQVIVHSPVMQDTLLRYGCATERLAMIPLGSEAVPASAAAPRAVGAGPNIVTMGGIAHTKGQHDALEAVARLHREFPGVRYRILGEVRDRSYLRFLERRIERLGLAACVRITPDVPQDEKEAALRDADLYLQPSHEEGFCLAYIEAAAVVPRLVGADAGAIRLIGADDPGARTVPVRAPSRMAQAMAEVLRATMPDDLMTSRAARLAARFSWAQYLDGHEELYARCLRGHETSNPGLHPGYTRS